MKKYLFTFLTIMLALFMVACDPSTPSQGENSGENPGTDVGIDIEEQTTVGNTVINLITSNLSNLDLSNEKDVIPEEYGVYALKMGMKTDCTNDNGDILDENVVAGIDTIMNPTRFAIIAEATIDGIVYKLDGYATFTSEGVIVGSGLTSVTEVESFLTLTKGSDSVVMDSNVIATMLKSLKISIT